MITIISVTFVIVLLSCAGLMLGQWFGRPPIHGRCAPGECLGNCGKETRCPLKQDARHG